MSKSSSELQTIARAGGTLKVDAKKYSSSELQAIARSLTSNSRLIVTNADTKSTSELQSIAQAGGDGKVEFDFTT